MEEGSALEDPPTPHLPGRKIAATGACEHGLRVEAEEASHLLRAQDLDGLRRFWTDHRPSTPSQASLSELPRAPVGQCPTGEDRFGKLRGPRGIFTKVATMDAAGVLTTSAGSSE